ncbi:unknown protein [Paenibacillus amylolyticus]|uniref:Uncharacterized protein n=1 Tax=Paenibacillus amylolyticus TaxID=1451 RepID=A0A117I148_PAEAM|nr:unknown protein [Paenibacillus amylolyticus]
MDFTRSRCCSSSSQIAILNMGDIRLSSTSTLNFTLEYTILTQVSESNWAEMHYTDPKVQEKETNAKDPSIRGRVYKGIFLRITL